MTHPRVAIQLISTGGIYGAERALLELAGYLRDEGWESHVVALEGHGAKELVNLATRQGIAAECFVPEGRLAFWPMVMRLRQLLRRHPRAIVHSHGYKPDILLAMLQIPRRLACVATCHSWYSETWKLKILETMDKRSVRSFDHVVAVSEEIASDLIGSGLLERQVSLIHNGISPPSADKDARRKLREEFGISEHAGLVIQIGRLARSKRNDLLLTALSKLPDGLKVNTLFVGDGNQRAGLVDQARRQGLERRVHFCGYRSDVADLLAASDVLALTSDKEGLPIILLEAMAMRCPIVATRVGAIPRVLSDGEDAWLVPSNDADALAAALKEALSSPEMTQERSERAHTEFVREYSRNSMGAQYLRIYESIWARRGWA